MHATMFEINSHTVVRTLKFHPFSSFHLSPFIYCCYFICCCNAEKICFAAYFMYSVHTVYWRHHHRHRRQANVLCHMIFQRSANEGFPFVQNNVLVAAFLLLVEAFSVNQTLWLNATKMIQLWWCKQQNQQHDLHTIMCSYFMVYFIYSHIFFSKFLWFHVHFEENIKWKWIEAAIHVSAISFGTIDDSIGEGNQLTHIIMRAKTKSSCRGKEFMLNNIQFISENVSVWMGSME